MGLSELFSVLTFIADRLFRISPASTHSQAQLAFAPGDAWARPRARLYWILQMQRGPDACSMSDAALCTTNF